MSDRFSDLRILRWHDHIKEAIDGGRPGPIRASLDLTNLCNDACPWCEPAEYRAETVRDRHHTLETDKALEVLQELGEMGCKTVNFSGGGEPLLHPDFGTILRFAVRQGLRTWIVTNGFYIDKFLPELMYAHHLRVSLDASNEAEHAEMHGKEGCFDKVCSNITALAGMRTRLKRPEIGISYLVADCNSSVESFARIFEFAEERRVDFLHFRPLSEDKPQRFTGDWPRIAEVIGNLSSDYPGVECFPMSKRWKDVFLQRDFVKCYAALTTAVVGANGDVQACCDRRDITFGNVYEQSFKSIWLGARHRKKATEIVPAFCQRCLMCGYNQSVEKYVVGNESLPELI